MIEPGQPAPDFELLDQDGEPVRLSALRGKPVVLYFYPKADTPGCTTQACGIRDHRADYAAALAAGFTDEGRLLASPLGFDVQAQLLPAHQQAAMADLVYAAQAHAGRRAATRGDCGMPYPQGWRPRRLARRP